MRSLSPEEAELWSRVAATIRPLSRDKNESFGPELREKPVAVRAVDRCDPSRSTGTARVRHRPGTTLDGSWDRKLCSGSIDPDRVLDLHGMTLDGAWRAIDRALEQAIAAGDRVVLLVTGHHRPGDPPVRRGRIRAAVHDWLAASRHAPRIASVCGAHPRHGGGGSLYLILRRR